MSEELGKLKVRKVKKFTVIVNSLIFIVLAALLFFLIITGITDYPKLTPNYYINKIKCEKNGGEYIHTYARYNYACHIKYSDAHQPCNSSDQCLGNCIARFCDCGEDKTCWSGETVKGSCENSNFDDDSPLWENRLTTDELFRCISVDF